MKPATYRAAVCTELTGPNSIQIQMHARSPLENGQIRLKVKAAGLNFPDLLMTYGKYQFRPDPPFIPGLEAAGEIVELAGDVGEFAIGDRVMAASKGGAMAEELVVPFSAAHPLPDAMTYEEGACWLTAASTAWHGLIAQGELKASESALILGASGGVGMAAVKLAKHIGALVIGTGSSPAKRKAIISAGADHALDPADSDLAAKVKELTGGNGTDIVYDPVGGDLALTATHCIARGGRYLIIGFASGTIPSFPANHILIKSYRMIGIRAGETPRRDPDLAKRQAEALAELAKQGIMRPHISHRFNLEHAGDALRALEKREIIGRAVLTAA